MKKVASQAMGLGLKWLGDVSGAEWLDRYGLRERATQVVERGARAGFRTVQDAGRRFSPLMKLAAPSRLPKPKEPPALFDLTLTDEQQMTCEMLRRFAEDVIRPAAREADDACSTPASLLEASTELGLLEMALPEALGGAGAERSPTTSILALEELAFGDLGVALALYAPLSVVNLLVDFGTQVQQERYLSPLAGAGYVPLALAVTEPTAGFDPWQLRTQATRSGEGWLLSGEKRLVPLGGSAELFVVAARTEAGTPALFLVERTAEGLTVAADPCMGARAADLSLLKLDEVRVTDEARLGGDAGLQAYEALISRAQVGWAAMAVGASRAVLEYVIPYCNERIAFGEPITNRQSVAFAIADIALEIDGMRLLTQRAASRAERHEDFRREAYLAALQAGEKGMQIGSQGVQLLGGHGFTKEHPVELWYRHLRAISLCHGTLYV
ncbi:MAG: acyl-CoA dehydrogenase family protein [Polyangiaceae bacterium]|nr:acyl-CoA dehydrogenase family protein [Polyangiaceae bacterium]MCW5789360.1 acyl-CoA dehydrogenase family protein [Polyangiaceae bacterium]